MLGHQSQTKFGDTSIQPIYSPLKNSGVLCPNGASTLLVATSTNPGYLRITNMTAQTVFLGMGVPAASSSGVMLAASSSIEFNQTNFFGGAIYCLGYGAAASTTYAETQ